MNNETDNRKEYESGFDRDAGFEYENSFESDAEPEYENDFEGGSDGGFEAEPELQEEGTTEIVPSERKSERKKSSGGKGGRKKKKRKKKHYLLKFVILVALCVAVYFLLHSSLFTVKKVKLAENSHMTLEQMKEVTGYKKGINLFEIDARKNEKKLEKDAYIKEADISRKLPDTIKVTLTLRDQTAAIHSDKGYVLIDDEGIVIDVLEAAPQVTLLDGITVKTAKKGEPVEVKETKKYDQYMELLDKIEKADMFFKKLSISGKNLTAYATDSLCCTGTISNIVSGMEEGNLQAVFYDLMQKGVTAGTVTVGDDQYYSFAK